MYARIGKAQSVFDCDVVQSEVRITNYHGMKIFSDYHGVNFKSNIVSCNVGGFEMLHLQPFQLADGLGTDRVLHRSGRAEHQIDWSGFQTGRVARELVIVNSEDFDGGAAD